MTLYAIRTWNPALRLPPYKWAWDGILRFIDLRFPDIEELYCTVVKNDQHSRYFDFVNLVPPPATGGDATDQPVREVGPLKSWPGVNEFRPQVEDATSDRSIVLSGFCQAIESYYCTTYEANRYSVRKELFAVKADSAEHLLLSRKPCLRTSDWILRDGGVDWNDGG